ncbi:MAG: hypothetical protein M3Z09_01185, partial [Acidobacteriota bacterium]|nr:hypothetical protein [Acidobacteriota bacterium]
SVGSGNAPLMDAQPGFARIAQVFGELKIPFYLGGSLASSVYGLARSTLDVDLIAAVRQEHAKPLSTLLSPDFYADEQAILEAISRIRAFNLIHYSTGYKFDIFPLQTDVYHELEFNRRTRMNLSAVGLPGIESDVASPEGIVLEKLCWYRDGGKISERQWNDVLSVLQLQLERLDWEYLKRWAHFLNVADLLNLARDEARPVRPASLPPDNP